MNDLKATVVARARRCGFDLVGVTGADDFAADRDAALERIRDGLMDGLPWYTESRVMRGSSPSELLPGARSVICLGLSYWREEGQEATDEREFRTGAGTTRLAGDDAGEKEGRSRRPEAYPRIRGDCGEGSGMGRVARYAWVRDYHRVMKRRMREFVRELERELGSQVDGPVVRG